MGSNSSASIQWGYNLGGPENGWLIKGLDEYDIWIPGWLKRTEEEVDEYIDEMGYEDIIYGRLLEKMAGFKEIFGDEKPNGYYKAQADALSRIGITVESAGGCCGQDYYTNTYILYVNGTQQTAHWGAMAINLETPDATANNLLALALKALDIEPSQSAPMWVLSSYYG